MTNVLDAYRPFNVSNYIYFFALNNSEEIPLCERVSRLVCAILLSPFTLALDLCLIGAKWYVESKSGAPLPLARGTDQSQSDLEFFKNGIGHAFSIVGETQKSICDELFKHDGELAEGPPPFDIYQWGAKAILIHYLLNAHSSYRGYPAKYRTPIKDQEMMRNQEEEVARLKSLYDSLSVQEQNESIRALLVHHPEPPLKQFNKPFVTLLSARGSKMCADSHYVEIYRDFTRG